LFVKVRILDRNVLRDHYENNNCPQIGSNPGSNNNQQAPQ